MGLGVGEIVMRLSEETQFRIRLVEGFLEEAHQDLASRRWRSCIDNSQLATENAAKALLAILGPVGRTHKPAVLLREALDRGRFPQSIVQQVELVAQCAELLGPDVHVQSDYGDEIGWRTPWELFDEADAQQALSIAEDAIFLTKQIVQG